MVVGSRRRVWTRARRVGAVVLGLAAALGGLDFVEAAPAVHEDRLDRSQVSRPLTLPRNVLRIDLGPPDLTTLDGGLLSGQVPRGVRVGRLTEDSSEVLFSIGAGLAFGLIRDLEVGAHFFPILVLPVGEYGDVELYGRYRFIDLPKLEWAVQVKFNLPTIGAFGAGLDVPMVYRLGKSVRLETGVMFEVSATSNNRNESDPTLGVHVPLAVLANFTPAVWGGLQSGLYTVPTGVDELVFARLGAVVGTTLGRYRSEPVADLMAIVRLPRLLDTSAADGNRAGLVDVIFGARFYFRLLD